MIIAIVSDIITYIIGNMHKENILGIPFKKERKKCELPLKINIFDNFSNTQRTM